MFKIEDNLLIKKENAELSLLNVMDEYYKEMYMLISNIHLTYVLMRENANKTFPLETNLYDGSWYKNLIVASNIIFDRLHMVIDENIPYDSIFNDKNKCNFRALANVWNKINFIIKYNLPDSLWNEKAISWNLVTTSRKIEEIVASNIQINYGLLESISFDLNKYKSVPKVLTDNKQHNYDELVNVLSGNNTNTNANNQQTTAPNKPPVPPQIPISPTNNVQNQQQPPVTPNNFGNNQFNPFPAAPTPVNSMVPPPPAAQPAPMINQNQRIEKAPIDPLKKELDAIVRWCDLKQETVKAYVDRKRLGYDPNEYKAICEYLPIVQTEISEINEFLANAKIRVPVDPLKAELDKLVRWCNLKEQQIKVYKRNKSSANANDGADEFASSLDTPNKKQLLREELQKIIRSLGQINNEVNYINNEISGIKIHLPKDPMIKEMQLLLKWIENKQAAVELYKKNLNKLDTVDDNDELKRINKEMQVISRKLKEIDEVIPSNDQSMSMQQLSLIRDKVRNDELERIQHELNVVDKKLNDDELTRINKEMSLLTNKLGIENAQNINNINIYDNDLVSEINKSKRLENWISKKERELILLQRKLTNRLNSIKDYDEKIIKFRNDFNILEETVRSMDNKNLSREDLIALLEQLNIKELLEKSSYDRVDENIIEQQVEDETVNTPSKFDEIKLINKQRSDIDDELNYINDEMVESKTKTKKLMVQDQQESENNEFNNQELNDKISTTLVDNENNETYNEQTDEELISEAQQLISKYHLEAQILQKAFEILPDELKESANAQLPQMINLLLEEGYINPKENVVLENKKVVKINN